MLKAKQSEYHEDDFQPESRATVDFQPKSRVMSDFQPKSRAMADFQVKSRSENDFQIKSRVVNNFQLKSREITSSSYPSSQNSFPSKPYWIVGDEFFNQVRNRLSIEQSNAFMSNIEEHYAGNQTIAEALGNADEILGTNNRDLSLTFHGMFISIQLCNLYPFSGPITIESDGMEFFLQARTCLCDKRFGAFLSEMKELNGQKKTMEETLRKVEEIFGRQNRDLFISCQGLLVSSQKSSAINSPPREQSNAD